MRIQFETEDELRRAFWQQHPNLDARKITNYAGNGTMFKTDTRCAWCDWLDMLSKDGAITQELAYIATLDD